MTSRERKSESGGWILRLQFQNLRKVPRCVNFNPTHTFPGNTGEGVECVYLCVVWEPCDVTLGPPLCLPHLLHFHPELV